MDSDDDGGIGGLDSRLAEDEDDAGNGGLDSWLAEDDDDDDDDGGKGGLDSWGGGAAGVRREIATGSSG